MTSDNNNFKDRWRNTPEIDDDVITIALPPEKRLLLAMIDGAMVDSRGKNEYDRERARDWFISEDDDENTFLWVCDCLDIEPNMVLKLLQGYEK